MADIASHSCGATTGLVNDLHHIARSVLHHIREEHRIVGYDQEASTSHGPSIKPPVSSTPIRMQSIRGRGRGRVDRRGRGRDGGRGHGRDSEGGRGTLESTLPTSIPPQTYTSPSIPPDTYTSLPYPVSLEPTSITVDITLLSHPLSFPALPPIGDTIIDIVLELGALPARRPRAPRAPFAPSAPSVPSAPSAPSALFEIA